MYVGFSFSAFPPECKLSKHKSSGLNEERGGDGRKEERYPPIMDSVPMFVMLSVFVVTFLFLYLGTFISDNLVCPVNLSKYGNTFGQLN